MDANGINTQYYTLVFHVLNFLHSSQNSTVWCCRLIRGHWGYNVLLSGKFNSLGITLRWSTQSVEKEKASGVGFTVTFLMRATFQVLFTFHCLLFKLLHLNFKCWHVMIFFQKPAEKIFQSIFKPCPHTDCNVCIGSEYKPTFIECTF